MLSAQFSTKTDSVLTVRVLHSSRKLPGCYVVLSLLHDDNDTSAIVHSVRLADVVDHLRLVERAVRIKVALAALVLLPCSVSEL